MGLQQRKKGHSFQRIVGESEAADRKKQTNKKTQCPVRRKESLRIRTSPFKRMGASTTWGTSQETVGTDLSLSPTFLPLSRCSSTPSPAASSFFLGFAFTLLCLFTLSLRIANPFAVANRVLVVGDAGRAERISHLFDSEAEVKHVKSSRGFVIFTGMYNGVSALAS